MERIKEKESMDLISEVEALDKFEKSFLPNWIISNFVDAALNIGPEKGKVLDIGTGSGLITIKMYEKNPKLEIIGLDLSIEMIKKAQENSKASNLQNKITFLVGDASNLPFQNSYFDLVSCNHLIHHLDSPVPLFNEIARIAKDDAAIMIRDVRRQRTKLQYQFYRLMLRAISGKKSREMTCDSLASAFTPEELVNFLRQSNLKDMRVVRYFLIPTILEIIVGIERAHKNKRNIKKIFPDTITLPFPGKKYLN